MDEETVMEYNCTTYYFENVLTISVAFTYILF